MNFRLSFTTALLRHLFFAGVHTKLATTEANNQATKHLAKKSQEKGQQAKPHWKPQEQDPVLPVLEKVLLYSHLFLSLFFFAVISIKWSS